MQNVHQMSWRSFVTRGMHACYSRFSRLTLFFPFSAIVFELGVSFFAPFGRAKGIENALRLTRNSSHRKHTLPSIGSPPLHLYISNCSLLPLQSYETKVDVQKQGSYLLTHLLHVVRAFGP
jgi:hypothetical protein